VVAYDARIGGEGPGSFGLFRWDRRARVGPFGEAPSGRWGRRRAIPPERRLALNRILALRPPDAQGQVAPGRAVRVAPAIVPDSASRLRGARRPSAEGKGRIRAR
jgi:hypothetical protein